MWRIAVIGFIISSCSCFSSASPRIATPSINISCEVIESSLFQIDLKCIENLKPSPNIRNYTATTPQSCTDRTQCQVDIFHWNRSQTCIAMTADVLSSCPLISDGSAEGLKSRLFFTVSQNMPRVLRQALLSKGYKYKIAELLGCNVNKYLCDDFTCIEWKQRCDGVAQCLDKSDEFSCPGKEKCLGRDGKYYGVGEEFAPHSESDVCKICICGSDSTAAYCYSPLCSTQLSDCTNSSPNICCRCFDDSYLKTSTSILGYSQRLLVSCLSVLFLISLLLILSRGFTQQALRRQSNQRMTQSNWISMSNRNLPPNRSFFETNSIRPCEVDFFGREADVPPPYPQLKSPENAGDNELPPSYEASTFHAEHPLDDIAVTSLPNDDRAEATRTSIEPGPVSPLSTTSDSPLLSSETNER